VTLTDFLLARLAEDEALALQVPEGWVPPFDRPLQWEGDYDMLSVLPARVLAEVEAKRQIVELLGDCHDGYVWDSGTGLRAELALCALALPYSDHPDFDPAWRP
jgi:hypothetical protein